MATYWSEARNNTAGPTTWWERIQFGGILFTVLLIGVVCFLAFKACGQAVCLTNMVDEAGQPIPCSFDAHHRATYGKR